MTVGDLVRVTRGKLEGMTGVCKGIHGEWVLISLTAWPVTIRVRLVDVRVERTAA